MNRLILCIAFACFVGSSSATVVRESARIEYTPKPVLTVGKSPQLFPGYEFRLKGLEWITWVNDGDTPCHIVFPSESRFSIECDGAKPTTGDLDALSPLKGKEYRVRIRQE